MNIRDSLLEEHSKALTSAIVDFVGEDHQRFSDLMNCYFDESSRISQRASWPVGFIGAQKPELIYPYLSAMLDNLENPVHNAIKRNTVRILSEIEVPTDLLGKVVDLCFRFLEDTKEAIAVRVFSMSTLYKIVQREPDLAYELKMIIESHYPHGSAGFKSRGKKILRGLEKYIKE